MSSSKRIILHLGANKTGSSAVQQFLAANHMQLRSYGCVVPDASLMVADKIEGYHVWAMQALMADEDGKAKLEDAIERIFASSVGNTIILSAENLAASPKAPALFTDIARKYQTSCLLYVRRQDDLLLSSWQQWHSKKTDDFWAWLISVLGAMGNWKAYIQAWEKVVPRKEITVRVYERKRLIGSDVTVDFLNYLDPSFTIESFNTQADIVNPSFSDAITDLVKGNREIFSGPHDNDFYHLVHRLTGENFIKDKRESIITFSQRKAILGRYSESNNWVKETYFDGKPLFSPPKEEDYNYLNDKAMIRKQLEFLVTMVYRIRGERKGKDSQRIG